MPVKSYQQEHPNISWVRMTPTNMPYWMGISSQVSNPTQRTTGNSIKLPVRETALRREEHTN